MAIRADGRVEGDVGLSDKSLGLPNGVDHSATPVLPSLNGGNRLLLPSREHYPGVRRLPFTIEKTDGTEKTHGVAFVFQGKTLLENLDYLRAIGTRFAIDNMKWPENAAGPLIYKAFGVQNVIDLYCALRGFDPKQFRLNDKTIYDINSESLTARLIPSVLAMRTPDMPPGEYGFISEQRMHYYHDQEEGEIPLYYHGLRVGYEGFRGQGWGRMSIHLGFLTHREVNHKDARYFHKSSNPIAWHTNTRAEELRQETSHPWSSEYNKRSLDWRAAVWLYNQVRLYGTRLEPSGIIRNEYGEPNLGFSSEELHGGALEKWQRMTDPTGYALGPLDAVLSGYQVVA